MHTFVPFVHAYIKVSYKQVYMCTFKYQSIHIHIHTYIYTHIHTHNHVHTLEGRKGIKRTNPSTVPRQMQLISMSAQHTFIVGDGDSTPSL